MNPSSEKHVFALFYEECQEHDLHHKVPYVYQLSDEPVVHRIKNVLRLVPGEQCVLFDFQKHMLVTIEHLDKKKCTITVHSITQNAAIEPHITFLLPLLKKDSLETAVYNLVELGVNTVQLVVTQKVQRKWQGSSERERLEKIIQSAAEQAKQYSGIKLFDPLSLQDALDRHVTPTSINLYMDPEGQKMLSIFSSEQKYNSFVAMVGPEGDLTSQEKSYIQDRGFCFYTLTPTILRSLQAVTLCAGMIRSLSSNN